MSGANRPAWFDPRMPDRSHCVLAELLRAGARECPERVLAVFEDGSSWNYAEALERAMRWAAGLQALGVRRGDAVLVWCPNGPQALQSWFAIGMLGACFVPINPAFRGGVLANVVASAQAGVLLAHASLVDRLASVETAGLRKVVVFGGSAPEPPASVAPRAPLEWLTEAELDAATEPPNTADDLMPWDQGSIIFTSGTTGASKGACSSWFHLYTAAQILHGHMSRTDRILVNAPLFHIGGTAAVLAALIHRGSFALVDGFKAASFWSIVRSTRSTMTSGLIGSMAPYLAKFGRADDAAGLLRRTHFYPVTPETIAFANEFGFSYYSGYGSTEVPLVLITDLETTVLGSCGRPRSGVECRLVDEFDQDVPAGTAGELIVRTDHTWSFSSGYNGRPEATATSWRNGWFHTGDLLRQDADGNYYFVDRLKDAIRRRGENISSQEVEDAVRLHPAVAEVAAIGVPSAHGEDDVMLVLTPRAGATLDPAALRSFLEPHLAKFMLPRHIRIVDALPKTPTDKVLKHVLRAEGVAPGTWTASAS